MLSCALRVHTSRDAQSSEEIVENSPDSGTEPQRHPEGLDATVQGNSQDEKGVEPIDMFVPVTTGEGVSAMCTLPAMVSVGERP